MPWYTVRIEHPSPERTLAQVEEFQTCDSQEMLALDSTPAVIAVLQADSPVHAIALAWERGKQEVQQIAKGVKICTAEDLIRALRGDGPPRLPESGG